MRSMVLFAAAIKMLAASWALAGEADVVSAEAVRSPDGTWRFTVTVRHGDTGWDHYADAWEVLSPDGSVLGRRELLHPHVTEQPFTRSLSGVVVPEDVDRVTVRARDSVHGYGGATVEVLLSP